MSDFAIITRGLTKEFSPGVGAVDVDLEVPRGCVYGFLGPNGAGKSTTIRMLVGMLHPDRGSAQVLGLDPETDPVGIQRRVGVLSSDGAVPRHHTGASLLRLLGRLRDDRGLEEHGRRLAERFLLDLSKPAHELSFGNRQKLGLVTALAHRPELAILDEPSNGLDPLLQRELHALLRQLAADGTTVLLSSHSLPEVERVADHVGFIRRARLVEQAPLATLAERALRRAVLRFDTPVPEHAFDEVEGVTETLVNDRGREVRVTWHGPVAAVLRRAGELGAASIEAQGADLEATFLALYADGEEPQTPPTPTRPGAEARRHRRLRVRSTR